MPGWRDEIASALNAWLQVAGHGRAAPSRRVIGHARPAGEAGWFVVDARGQRLNPDQLDQLVLAPEQQDGHGKEYPVLETVVEGEALRVRTGAYVTAQDLLLQASLQPAAYLIERLRDDFTVLADPGLADILARGQLTPLPPAAPAATLPAGLNPAQLQTYAACFAPGVFMAWGPPGAGKSRILAEAILDLLNMGKRVLLVSGTNIAVDNALQMVVDRGEYGPGDLVRVGPPHLRKLADNDAVALPRLVARQLHHVERQRQDVERLLRAFHDRRARLTQLDATLAGYDHEAYTRAAERLRRESRIRPLAERAAALGAAAKAAEEAAATRERECVQARVDWEATDTARAHLEEAARLSRQIDDRELKVGVLHGELLDLEARTRDLSRALEQLQALPAFQRLRQRATIRAAETDLRAAAGRRDELAGQYRRAREATDRQVRILGARIQEHHAAAAPFDAEAIAWRAEALQLAEVRLAEAKRTADAADDELTRAQQVLLAAEAARPSAAERQLVERLERAGTPARHAERERLRAEARREEPQQEALEQRHEQLIDQMKALQRDAETAIICGARLVATTLARSRLERAITKAAPFDVVLIDEVAAATVPEVLLAVAKARETAVLLGDFLQLPPIVPEELTRLRRPDVEKWLLDDCFHHCGITTAAHAVQHPGCAVLDWQFRFGPAVMELANRATYAGVLKPGGTRNRVEDPEHPEIVVVDTDGLGDLARIQRSSKIRGWWLAGSLLARALAMHHHTEGRERAQAAGLPPPPKVTIGVVTPYNDQVDATLEALRDAEAGSTLRAEVGTVHRFQGREFDVVIFDLVEDGNGWVSKGRLGRERFERNGARLFNVGITRTTHRLYLVVSGPAVRNAAHGTVLSHVRAMIDAGRIGIVKASDYLTPAGPGPQEPPSPFGRDLAAALAKHVQVRSVADEHAYYQALRDDLAAARESIWIWAPWTTNRLGQVLPLLEQARDRGVTVTVFIRTDSDQVMRRPESQAWVRQLKAAASRVVRYDNMHQKLVIIDERTTWLGSLNTLSHSRTRELMVLHQGRQFARMLLKHEQAEVLAASPPCKACGAEVEVVRSTSAKQGYPFYWRCADQSCRRREPIPVPRARPGR